MHKTSISLFLGLWFIFNALNPTSVYAAAVGGASSGGSGGSGGVEVDQAIPKESFFKSYEKIRYEDTTLKVKVEEVELETVVPDHFESLLMSAGRAKGVIWTLGKETVQNFV